VKTVDGKVVRY